MHNTEVEPTTPPLTESELAQIERDLAHSEWATFPMTTEQVRALCQTVRALREQLAQAEKEREAGLVEVLENFRSKNIRRIDLIEALLKEGLIHADERHGQLTNQ